MLAIEVQRKPNDVIEMKDDTMKVLAPSILKVPLGEHLLSLPTYFFPL